MNLQQNINRFITEPANHLPTPSIKVGQSVVFFHTKDEPVPAVVIETSRNNNGIIANLHVYIPDFIRKVTGIGAAELNISQEYYLKEELRARTYLTYPEIIFSKAEIALANPISGTDHNQTHTDQWYPTDISSQPRLYGVQTNQVGKFFDPKFYKFQIFCHKDAYKDLREHEIEAEEALFPSPLPLVNGFATEIGGIASLIRRSNAPNSQLELLPQFYDTFNACYEEFFRQKYQLRHDNGSSRWDKVEIRAFYKSGGSINYLDDGIREEVASINDFSNIDGVPV